MAPQGLRGLIAESKSEEVIDIMQSDEEREKINKKDGKDGAMSKMMVKLNAYQRFNSKREKLYEKFCLKVCQRRKTVKKTPSVSESIDSQAESVRKQPKDQN